MIITKLQGGLGNQMFQYAAGLALAHKLGTILKLDIQHYENDPLRQYCLHGFALSSGIASAEEIKRLKDDSLFSNIAEKIFGKKKNVFIEPDHHFFYPQLFDLADDAYIDGYWQREEYFKNISNIIKKEFTLKNPFPDAAKELIDSICSTNSISVAIRRGDYITPKYRKIFYECSPEYYSKAITLISKRVSNPHFFVTTDDIEYAKTLSFPKNTFYIEPAIQKLENFQEIAIMSMCKHNIIANSSFSWWGAWLNQNPDKIIIAPKQWFVGQYENVIDMIPETWIKL